MPVGAALNIGEDIDEDLENGLALLGCNVGMGKLELELTETALERPAAVASALALLPELLSGLSPGLLPRTILPRVRFDRPGAAEGPLVATPVAGAFLTDTPDADDRVALTLVTRMGVVALVADPIVAVVDSVSADFAKTRWLSSSPPSGLTRPAVLVSPVGLGGP